MTISKSIHVDESFLPTDIEESPVLRVLGGYFSMLAERRRAQEEIENSSIQHSQKGTNDAI